jgi:hypothetical protein
MPQALGPTQPPIQWVPGALSLGVKQLGREADHSPPASSKVKNACSYTSTPQYIFMAWCLVKHRDNFTFTFYREELRTWQVCVDFFQEVPGLNISQVASYFEVFMVSLFLQVNV